MKKTILLILLAVFTLTCFSQIKITISGNGGTGGTGNGTVAAGLANRIGYYIGPGTTISPLFAISSNRALMSDVNGLPIHSTVNGSELAFLSGATSNIQAQFTGIASQLTGKLNTTGGNLSGALIGTSAVFNATGATTGLQGTSVSGNAVVGFSTSGNHGTFGTNGFTIKNSNRVLINTGTDDGVNYLQVNGGITSSSTITGAVVRMTGGLSTQHIMGDGSTLTALSLTTIGSSGASTYNPSTGVLNIPNYAGGSGLTSLNGLTGGVQTFAVTTTGTDFTISSTGTVHSANMPTVSGTARGLVTSALFNTWNAKQSAISLTTIGSGAATFIGNVLNIPTASGFATTDALEDSMAALRADTIIKINPALPLTITYNFITGKSLLEINPVTNSQDGYMTFGKFNEITTATSNILLKKNSIDSLEANMTHYVTQGRLKKKIDSLGVLIAGGVSGVSSVNTMTGAVSIGKADVGLGNADNTTDLNKPISTATQTALDIKYSTMRTLPHTLTDGATITWDIAGTAKVNGVVTLGAAGRTLSIINPVQGEIYLIKIIQDGTGSRTITTWPTNTKWPGGTAPTLTTTANRYDIITFYYDGTNFNGNFGLNYN